MAVLPPELMADHEAKQREAHAKKMMMQSLEGLDKEAQKRVVETICRVMDINR